MAVNLSPVGGVAAQFFTNTGAVLTGGKLYTYLAGTTTPTPAYTSSNGATPWANPIVLDAAGRVSGSGEIWLTDGINYKFVLKDSNDVLIATYDNISGINSNFLAFVNQQQIITATAGQTVFNLSISYQPGTNSLSVFVDGVNQYGPGAQYAYTETDSDTVTFVSGLHVGAEVKFTTTQQQSAGAVDASQVTYTPAGAGAVATNVQAKLRQTVSIMDFGAVGDGTTDNTTAIQAAITAASSIYVPAGIFLCGDLTLDADTTLFGTGISSQLKRKSGLTTAAWITGTNTSNVLIENLCLDGNSIAGNTGDTLRLITTNGSQQIAVRGCFFQSTGNGCVVVLGDWDGIQVTNNWFSYAGNTNIDQTGVNIEWFSSPATYPKNFIVSNNTFYKGYYGFYCGGVLNGTVSSNTFEQQTFAVLLYAGDGNVSAVSPLENVVVSSNVIMNSVDSSIRIDGKAALNNTIQSGAYRINILGNQIYYPGNVGILAINGINFCQFSNNAVYTAGDDGIKIDRVYADVLWNCNYNLVSNNTIVSSGARGVDLRNYVSYTLVEGNVIRGSTGSNIYIPNSTNTYNQLINNSVTGSGAAEISNSGANTTIIDNFGYVTQNSGSASGSGTSFTVTHGLVSAPTVVLVTSTTATPETISVTAKASTTFTVTFAGSGAHTLDWQASV
jgi:parallel beta-helix repeat protein